jgi:uncharacterized membrane protein (UPF0127 family)
LFYTVINESNNKLLVDRLFLADGFLTRFKGLMGREKINPREGILLVPCNSVHTMFMRFNLDLVFLDKNNSVIKIIAGLGPWKIVLPVSGAVKTLELPEGTVERSNTGLGNILKIQMSEIK